jgi:hypothetical protein
VQDYDELIAENLRLQAILTSKSSQDSGSKPPSRFDKRTQVHIRSLLERATCYSTVSSFENVDSIIFPSSAVSKSIMQFAESATSSGHFAMNFKEFDVEHEDFCQRILDGNGDKLSVNPSWLALYFSLLSVTPRYLRQLAYFLPNT